jgi:hypothetical protein
MFLWWMVGLRLSEKRWLTVENHVHQFGCRGQRAKDGLECHQFNVKAFDATTYTIFILRELCDRLQALPVVVILLLAGVWGLALSNSLVVLATTLAVVSLSRLGGLSAGWGWRWLDGLGACLGG